MAPRMPHLQLIEEGEVRKIDRRQKCHFSSSLNFPRRLSAIFSATNLKMAKKPSVMRPPVLGHHAAIRTAPDFSSVGLGLTQWLCYRAPPLKHARRCSRASWSSLIQSTLGGLCCTSQGGSSSLSPWCLFRVTLSAQLLLFPVSFQASPMALTWTGMETSASVLLNCNKTLQSVAFCCPQPSCWWSSDSHGQGLNQLCWRSLW